MMKIFLRKYWFVITIFITYQCFLYLNRINLDNPIGYINFILYFITFLIIRETLSWTKLNKTLVFLFYYFYGYLSIFMSLAVLTRNNPRIDLFFYVYVDCGLRLFILMISFYVALNSFKFWHRNEKHTILWSVLLAVLVLVVNYFKYLIHPLSLSNETLWADYAVRNYVTTVLSIFAMLIFWYRYYQKYFVVSEYLNIILFILTLSNIVEALHFVAFQYSKQIWYYGQIFNFLLNLLMLLVWYGRLIYLESDISIENERYLANFQFLNGFVSKPKKSMIVSIIPLVSLRYVIAIIFSAALILLGLFLINNILSFC